MDKRLKYLNAIRSFECAARHQSYSKAAEELFVSQAAISQQMRQLESVLEIQLFTRVGHKMSLTPSGEKLYNAAKQGLNVISQGLNSIQNEKLEGELIITSTQAFCSLWLITRLHKFSMLNPSISVKILGSNQIEDFHKQHIDLAIRFGDKERINNDESLTWEYFGEDVVYPVCSAQLLRSLPLEKPEDLLKCQLVSLACETRVTWKNWFESVGVQDFHLHTKKLEVTSSDMALNSVITGHSVTLAASGMFGAYMQSGELVIPFKLEHPHKWKRHLVYDPHSVKSKRIKIFKDWLIDEMKSTDPSFNDKSTLN